MKYTDPSGWRLLSPTSAEPLEENGASFAGRVGRKDVFGRTPLLNSSGSTMLNGIFYSPNQQYYINPITGLYMFGNQAISRNEFIYKTAQGDIAPKNVIIHYEKTNWQQISGNYKINLDPTINTWIEYEDVNSSKIDKYFTAMGALGLITDTKNMVLENLKNAGNLVSAEGKYLKYSKGLGTTLSFVTTSYSGYKVYNQLTDDVEGNLDGWDVADLGFGSAGLLSTGATVIYTALGMATPIGWVALGVSATAYFTYRLCDIIYEESKKP